MKKRRVTKIALIILALVCVFAIVACSGGKKDCEANGHAYGDWVSNGDGTHTKTCANNDQHKVTENCSGGFATCTEKATCASCKAKFGDVLKHIYTEKAEATYLKSAATCTEKAVYYKSCSRCGEKDTATFEYGNVEHTLNADGVCTICNQPIGGTKNIVYATYGNYAAVKGYTGTESNVVIATFYEGLPVEIISNDAFKDCTSLTSVTIPDSVTSIWGNAFEGCTSLTSIKISDKVTSMGWYVFRGCTSLTSVTIPDSVTNTGEGVFYGCTSLTSVTIGNGITSIGINTFYGCTALTSVTIGNGVTSIGKYAFYGCTSLTSIKIPDNVTKIDEYAFYGCKLLKSITMSEGMTRIDNHAFCGCTALTSIMIPDGVTYIGYGAFEDCESLESVYYKGTAAKWANWDEIRVDYNNDYLVNATRYYYSETQPTDSGNYWHYVDGKPTVWASDGEN